MQHPHYDLSALLLTESSGDLTVGTDGTGPEQRAFWDGMVESDRLRSILRELTDIVVTEGFRQLTVTEIAARLRCSMASLYRLADSGDELIALCVRLWLAKGTDRRWQLYTDASDWAGRLAALLRTNIVLVPGTSSAFVEDVRSHAASQRILAASNKRLEIARTQAIKLGIADGSFNPVQPQVVVECLSRAMEGVLHREFLDTVGLTPSQALTQARMLFEHGLVKS